MLTQINPLPLCTLEMPLTITPIQAGGGESGTGSGDGVGHERGLSSYREVASTDPAGALSLKIQSLLGILRQQVVLGSSRASLWVCLI